MFEYAPGEPLPPDEVNNLYNETAESVEIGSIRSIVSFTTFGSTELSRVTLSYSLFYIHVFAAGGLPPGVLRKDFRRGSPESIEFRRLPSGRIRNILRRNFLTTFITSSNRIMVSAIISMSLILV